MSKGNNVDMLHCSMQCGKIGHVRMMNMTNQRRSKHMCCIMCRSLKLLDKNEDVLFIRAQHLKSQDFSQYLMNFQVSEWNEGGSVSCSGLGSWAVLRKKIIFSVLNAIACMFPSEMKEALTFLTKQYVMSPYTDKQNVINTTMSGKVTITPAVWVLTGRGMSVWLKFTVWSNSTHFDWVFTAVTGIEGEESGRQGFKSKWRENMNECRFKEICFISEKPSHGGNP